MEYNSITYFRTNPTHSQEIRVDKEKSVLYGVSVVEVGEAKGHGLDIELNFLNDLVKLAKKQRGGVKSNYDHPSRFNPGFGNFAGNVTNFRLDDTQTKVLADIKLDKEIGEATNPQKYNYAMLMSEKHPSKIGMSIAFQSGWPYQYDEGGTRIDYRIKTVDGESVYNKKWDWSRKIYATIEALNAVDFVDEPAATSGLFAKGNEDIKKYFETKKVETMAENTENKTLTPEDKSKVQKLYDKFFGKKEAAPEEEIETPEAEEDTTDFSKKINEMGVQLNALTKEVETFKAKEEKWSAEKKDLEAKVSNSETALAEVKKVFSELNIDAGNGSGDNVDNGGGEKVETWSYSQVEKDALKRQGLDPAKAALAYAQGKAYNEV